jgi:hypothetical protein
MIQQATAQAQRHKIFEISAFGKYNNEQTAINRSVQLLIAIIRRSIQLQFHFERAWKDGWQKEELQASWGVMMGILNSHQLIVRFPRVLLARLQTP